MTTLMSVDFMKWLILGFKIIIDHFDYVKYMLRATQFRITSNLQLSYSKQYFEKHKSNNNIQTIQLRFRQQQMIIENDLQFREQDELTREVQQYKRINASLKKKIHARDKKICYLFSCIDQMSKSSVEAVENNKNFLQKNHSQIQHLYSRKNDGNFTDPKKREKQNISQNQQNLFKDKESQFTNRLNKDNIKLPILDRKSGPFDETNQELSNSRPRMIKVSLEKLIPLRAEEVKKKFQSKYK